MLLHPKTVPPELSVSALAQRITSSDTGWNVARLFPIIGVENTLLGVVNRADVLAALDADPDSTVLEAGVENPITIHPEQTLAEAADRMILHSIGRLPVVDRSDPPRLLGLVSRREILEARQHRLDAEKRG